MQRTLLLGLLAVTCISPVVSPVRADGLDKSHVPASARAVVHIDVEALVASQIARKVQELNPEANVQFDLGQVQPMLAGIRPLQEVRSVTLFCADPKSQKFGAIVHCTDKVDALLDMAMAVDGYELAPIDNWQVHSWSNDGQRVYGAVVPIGNSKERLVLLANDTKAMGEGMAVLQGRGQSLAQGALGQLGVAPERGTIVFAASNEPLSQLGEIDPSSPVARLVQGFVLQAGEAQGRIFANVSLATAEPRDAQRVQHVLQGLAALASLVTDQGMYEDDADTNQIQVLQQLASAVKFQTNGNLLYVEFSYDLEQLIHDLQTLDHH